MPQFFDVDENNSQRETSIWVEKYRPKKLEDYIGNEKIKKKANYYNLE